MAFVDSLVNDTPAPCSGRDGLVALIMAIAAGISAEERRWVQFDEVLVAEGIINKPALAPERPMSAEAWVKAALRGIERDPNSETDLREVFILFDLDSDGEVTAPEVSEALTLLGLSRTPEQARASSARCHGLS
eukprot:5985355-Pleurochrysis_carterae.AAC.1